jgi:GNAT superfamily N-acetyltransferase
LEDGKQVVEGVPRAMSTAFACDPPCPPQAGIAPEPGERLALRNGSHVLIRRVRQTDATLLSEIFAGMSERSRRMRFLMGKDRLSAADLHALTNLDSRDRTALAAVGASDGTGVGIARYARDAARPHVAEVAVTVVDDWQRRGLGQALLTRLAAHARDHGIRRFSADMYVDNVAMLGLLRSLNAEVSLVNREFGTVRYEVDLGRHFCDMCGRRMTWTPDGRELLNQRPRQVCAACIRAYVPKIQANLADPWWV